MLGVPINQQKDTSIFSSLDIPLAYLTNLISSSQGYDGSFLEGFSLKEKESWFVATLPNSLEEFQIAKQGDSNVI